MNNNLNKSFKDKRKWQIALRRYIINQNPCIHYAPYFGLDIMNFRKWIEIQFNKDLSWENFGTSWQLEHIIPLIYFNLEQEADLKLCWNFINIRISHTDLNKNENRLDILATKKYFNTLFEQTGHSMCQKMVEKIEHFESLHDNVNLKTVTFIKQNTEYLQMISHFNSYEFSLLNEGKSVANVLLEKKILQKFGS